MRELGADIRLEGDGKATLVGGEKLGPELRNALGAARDAVLGYLAAEQGGVEIEAPSGRWRVGEGSGEAGDGPAWLGVAEIRAMAPRGRWPDETLRHLHEVKKILGGKIIDVLPVEKTCDLEEGDTD
jgi:hypothetical protein